MCLRKSLRVVCAERDITQRYVADKAGMSESQLSNMFVNGAMSVKNLQRVCDALNLKVWEFCKKGDY